MRLRTALVLAASQILVWAVLWDAVGDHVPGLLDRGVAPAIRPGPRGSRPVAAPATVADWPIGYSTGRLVRTLDGDTAALDLSLGYGTHYHAIIRISEVDSPELRGPTAIEGRAAREHLRSLLEGRVVYVRATGERSFERWVGSLWIEGEGGKLEAVADQMVRAGHARRVDH